MASSAEVMKKKFALIIQGPLISVGRSGQDAHITKTALKGRGAFVNYDCRENISKTIKDFGDIFDSIIISTWDNELRPDDNWPKATIIASPDPGETQREHYVYRGLNKHRQFIGINAGLKEVEKNASIDYVVRIRTDQYMNLQALVDSFLARINQATVSPEDIIGVPLTRPSDYMTHDLYFVAKPQTLRKLCDAVLAFDAYEFTPCVHRDMLLKHAYVNYEAQIGVPPWAYFAHWPPLGASAETKKIFNFMYKHVFFPLGPEVYKTVVARGSLQSPEHIEEQFAPSKDTKNILNISPFISIDWERYFNFQKKTTGKTISPKDQIIIRTGKLAWKLMNRTRNLAKKTRVTSLLKAAYKNITIS